MVCLIIEREKTDKLTNISDGKCDVSSDQVSRFLNYCMYSINRLDFDFQQCCILTGVDSDEPVQPPFMYKLRNSKWCSVSSLTIIEYSSD